MLNKVFLIGRLGADPEIRILAGGQKVANFRLATSEFYRDRNGNRQEHTEWHNVVVFGNLAEVVAERLSKGRLVYIEGSLRTRSWKNRDGHRRYATEIVVQTVKFMEPSKGQPPREPVGGEEPGIPESSPDSDLPF